MDFKEYLVEDVKQTQINKTLPWVARCLGKKEEDIARDTGLVPRKSQNESVIINEDLSIQEICKNADIALSKLKVVIPQLSHNVKFNEIHQMVKAKL